MLSRVQLTQTLTLNTVVSKLYQVKMRIHIVNQIASAKRTIFRVSRAFLCLYAILYFPEFGNNEVIKHL